MSGQSHISTNKLHLDKTTVDNEANPVYCHAGLGDIRREDYLARIPRWWVKDDHLFFGWQSGIEGERKKLRGSLWQSGPISLGITECTVNNVRLSAICNNLNGLVDLLAASQKDQDIPRRLLQVCQKYKLISHCRLAFR